MSSSADVQALQKDVRKKKRIASELASELHDLVEDRLLIDYAELPQLASRTHDACVTWAEAQAKLDACIPD